MPKYSVVEDLPAAVPTPLDSSASQTLHTDDRCKVVAIAVASGQEIPQQAASPTTLQVVKGQVRLTLDGEEKELSAGAWVFMESNVRYVIYARTELLLLLTRLTK